MNPFEELIRELSTSMETTLHPDSHQSCLITFPQDQIAVQIDLDTNADRILVGSQLGRITPGPYRESLFIQALKANGASRVPRGILAFSEKNDTLVLFHYFHLGRLTGEKLYQFLQLFCEQIKIWKQALSTGNIPIIQEEASAKGSGMFGLKP